jgi:cytochrome P450 family 6
MNFARIHWSPSGSAGMISGMNWRIPSQLDEKYYPDPTRFDPDRFSKENKLSRHPMAFLAFSNGPRACIGRRFALLEVKVALVTLLRKFNVTAGPKTPDVIVLARGSVTSRAENTLWVKAEERKYV